MSTRQPEDIRDLTEIYDLMKYRFKKLPDKKRKKKVKIFTDNDIMDAMLEVILDYYSMYKYDDNIAYQLNKIFQILELVRKYLGMEDSLLDVIERRIS